jgi:hypothetical protein
VQCVFLELKLYFYIFKFKSSECKVLCVDSRQTSATPSLRFILYTVGTVRTLDIKDDNVGQKECNKLYTNVLRVVDVGRHSCIIEMLTSASPWLRTVQEER